MSLSADQPDIHLVTGGNHGVRHASIIRSLKCWGAARGRTKATRRYAYRTRDHLVGLAIGGAGFRNAPKRQADFPIAAAAGDQKAKRDGSGKTRDWHYQRVLYLATREVLTWTADFVHDEARRRLVWLWAFCMAADRVFSAALRSKGLAKSTAYDRLNKLWMRYLPNACEGAEESKRRAYREYGIAIIDVENDRMPWEFREWLKQWAGKRFGERRAT